ncbi:hypothetical protein C0Z19_22090 [Trinickia soli]|uniref:Uncharacterized protein n=1 Tax=Trinickia soli TaxID=380675 RepID=A0A2N7VP42_9BURK|nr:hypothetical protein CIW54_15985 [Paraburkholderia sp. T12-10]PMS18939.1 hypothetical protein C0Z19_22090 [Trinickia soli]
MQIHTDLSDWTIAFRFSFPFPAAGAARRIGVCVRTKPAKRSRVSVRSPSLHFFLPVVLRGA